MLIRYSSLLAELGFFLQFANLQLANLLQNCLIQKTISNSLPTIKKVILLSSTSPHSHCADK